MSYRWQSRFSLFEQDQHQYASRRAADQCQRTWYYWWCIQARASDSRRVAGLEWSYWDMVDHRLRTRYACHWYHWYHTQHHSSHTQRSKWIHVGNGFWHRHSRKMTWTCWMNHLLAFEMKCLMRILNIKWQQRIKNKDIMKTPGTNINIVENKLNFFSHICRIQDDRLINQVVFWPKKNKKNKSWRPTRRWTDDLVDWCNKDTETLYWLAMDRMKWIQFMEYVMDTNEHWASKRQRERQGVLTWYRR